MKNINVGLYKKKHKEHSYLIVITKVPDSKDMYVCSEYSAEGGWNDLLICSEACIENYYAYISDCRDRDKLPIDILEVIPEVHSRLDKVKHA